MSVILLAFLETWIVVMGTAWYIYFWSASVRTSREGMGDLGDILVAQEQPDGLLLCTNTDVWNMVVICSNINNWSGIATISISLLVIVPFGFYH